MEKHHSYARRIIVVVAGSVILLAGVVMIVLPGPAILLVPLGLAILGTEFHWARKLLYLGRAGIKRIRTKKEGGGINEKNRQ